MTDAFTAFWPLRRLPDDELMGEAVSDLAVLARRAGARIVGRPTWGIVPGSQHPGAGAYAWVLTCRAPAERVESRRAILARVNDEAREVAS